MSEPLNPLFEEEKEFLERKKLEYERALRGDVEHIKEQSVQVGKIALAGAGLLGGIWLLRKAFGRRKHPEWHHEEEHDDAFGGFGEDDYPEHDGYSSPQDKKWGAAMLEDDDEEEQYQYQQDQGNDFDDDNGLSEFPDFEAHSSRQHGSDAASPAAGTYHAHGPETEHNETADGRPFWSAEHSHPSANLPYDDSRRMPASNSFADADEPAEEAHYVSTSKKSWVAPALSSFVQSETGRVIMAQAAAVALALVTKAVKDLLPGDEAEPAKTSDLAASTAAGAHAYGQPAAPAAPQSPVSDAKDPDTDSATYQPLA
ncbi:MAG: hypothetical protein ACRYFX_00770 [Janthinobacterium lividum]